MIIAGDTVKVVFLVIGDTMESEAQFTSPFYAHSWLVCADLDHCHYSFCCCDDCNDERNSER